MDLDFSVFPFRWAKSKLVINFRSSPAKFSVSGPTGPTMKILYSNFLLPFLSLKVCMEKATLANFCNSQNWLLFHGGLWRYTVQYLWRSLINIFVVFYAVNSPPGSEIPGPPIFLRGGGGGGSTLGGTSAVGGTVGTQSVDSMQPYSAVVIGKGSIPHVLLWQIQFVVCHLTFKDQSWCYRIQDCKLEW